MVFSIVWNWFKDILSTLGLHNKKGRLVFLGLDNAGKTTLLHMLKDNKMAAHQPTWHPHAEELMIGKICFHTIDLGGHETTRRIWQNYYGVGLTGIVFLVDAADRSRLKESAEELSKLLAEESLSDVPICILGNKIDVPTACSEDELRNELSLYSQSTFGRLRPDDWTRATGPRPVEIFMTSIIMRQGYGDGIRWLAQFID